MERCDLRECECDCQEGECRVDGHFHYVKTEPPFIVFKAWEIAVVAILICAMVGIGAGMAEAHYKRVDVERKV